MLHLEQIKSLIIAVSQRFISLEDNYLFTHIKHDGDLYGFNNQITIIVL
jgi:hypothetical protein